jgi:AcrR family transcriptional regulator
MQNNSDLKSKILETGLKLSKKRSWESVSLHDIAKELNISLKDIHQYYPQKDDLAEAWFDEADKKMLSLSNSEEFASYAIKEKLEKLIMTWLDALSEYKSATKDMLMYKLEFGHIHLQTLGIMRLSRTVQWIREAAEQDSTHARRIIEETALTSIFLATCTHWLIDSSPTHEKTRNKLKSLLNVAERFSFLLDFIPSAVTTRPRYT